MKTKALAFITILLIIISVTVEAITPIRDIDRNENPFPTNPKIFRWGNVLCTPENKDFSYYRYKEKIPFCKRRVSLELKNSLYKLYNIPLSQKRFYSIDHKASLFAGGNNEKFNLWPEHLSLKSHRWPIEQELFYSIRANCISQKSVLRILLNNKFDPDVFNKPSYSSYGSLGNYLFTRENNIFWDDFIDNCDNALKNQNTRDAYNDRSRNFQ